MAKWKKGILDLLSGSIGNVVVASWKGIPYIRSKPSGNPSNTPAQQRQRSKFGVAIRFVNQLKPVINRGFKLNTDRMTELNSATSYLMKQAFIFDEGIPVLNYPAVRVARGSLPRPAETSAKRDGPSISLQWTMRENAGAKRRDDYLLAVAYDAENERAFCKVATDVRRINMQYQFIPEGAQPGQPLHIYLALANSKENDACDSMYLGLV